MNFSEPIKLHNSQMKWSECGHLLATASGPRLTIWDAANLEVLQVFTTKESVDYMEFSPDSNFILAAHYKSAEINLFAVNSPEWNGRISEGLAGLIKTEWSADSRYIITVPEFSVKLTFWSLTNKSVSYIRNPKLLGRGVHYNKDRSLGIVVERQNCRDVINILSTEDWSLVRQFETDTEDLAGLEWCPNIDSFVVWDTPLKYRLQVYTEDGRVELDYSAYEHQLGVRRISFSSSGKLMAVASFDNRIRIFSTLVWTLVHEMDHFPSLHEGDPVSSRAVIYQEEDVPLLDLDARLALELGGGLMVQQSKFKQVNERPLFLDFQKPDPKKGTIKIGVQFLRWSSCGRYIGSVCENLCTTVWVWDLETLMLAAIVVHKSPVKNMSWDPVQPRLAIVTGGAALYFWTPLGCVVGRIPPVSRGTMGGVTEVVWNPRGSALALFTRESGVLCRLQKKMVNNLDDDLDTEPSKDSSS